jgi:hypothetical protein
LKGDKWTSSSIRKPCIQPSSQILDSALLTK